MGVCLCSPPILLWLPSLARSSTSSPVVFALRPCSASPTAPRPCRWCRTDGTDVCLGCNQVVHFKQYCRAWNRGAHRVYAPTAASPTWLCPDCAWQWWGIVARSPIRPAQPVPSALQSHLQSLAASCLPGSGSISLPAQAGGEPLRARRVRRWLIRFLRRSGWTRLADLHDHISVAIPHEYSNRALSRVLSAMLLEGTVVRRNDGFSLS